MLGLEVFYSYTEKNQQKRTRKTKQNKTKQRKIIYSEQLYRITILALNKSIQAVVYSLFVDVLSSQNS